ncbi:hypothetical protein FRB96_003162 [Tulasnella sp. 330]|nr:hypothetical protein FRB96_003162 [Tulasnella sp. 330]
MDHEIDQSPPSQPLTPLDLAHSQHQRRAAPEQGQIIDPNDYPVEHGEDSAEAGAAGAKRSRPHAQTVHSDKHTENEIMMRELTSLHTQLAAKTSKVNRDVYTTGGADGKRRGGNGDAGSSTGAGVRAGGVAGPGSYDAHAVGPYGPPGMPYHQLPPGYPHPHHPGYPMLPPPGQYDGYHPGYYPPPPPPVAGQGQPYPSYPPSFGPAHGAVYPGGNVGYAPYPQAQYPPPVSPAQYRNPPMVYPDPTHSPDPNTPLTPNSTTPLSANSVAGHSFLGSSESSTASHHHQQHQGGNESFLGPQRGGSPSGQQQQQQQHDTRAFTDPEGHLVPPPASSGGGHPQHGNHSFRNQQQPHSPIAVSPVSVHSSSYDDANGSDAGSGVNGDVISGGPDSNGRQRIGSVNGSGNGEQHHGGTSGFDGTALEQQQQQPYVVVNGHGQPSGFDGGGPGDDDGGPAAADGSSAVKAEQGFRQRGAGWESGSRNSTAASRDQHKQGSVDVAGGRVRAESGAGAGATTGYGGPGATAVRGGGALGFGDRHAAAADSGHAKQQSERDGYAADPKAAVTTRRPGTSGHGHQQQQPHGLGHGSTRAQSPARKAASSIHQQREQQQHEAGYQSRSGVQPEGDVPPQRGGVQHHWRGGQQQQSRGFDVHGGGHPAHAGGPPELVSATGGEAGPLPPLSAVIPHRSPRDRQQQHEYDSRRRVHTNVPDHLASSTTRDSFLPPTYGVVEPEHYGRPGTAPAAYVDTRHFARPGSGLSRSGSRPGRDGSGAGGGGGGTHERVGHDPVVLGGDRERRLPSTTTAPASSGGIRVGSGHGGGLVSAFQSIPFSGHHVVGSGKPNIYTSPSSDSPFSFHPPDVPIDDNGSGGGGNGQQHNLGHLHVYRPASGRPFSGVSSIGGDSSVPSSSYGRPSTSGGSVFGGSGRPFSSSSGVGYGHVGSERHHDQHHNRYRVRPGTATSTTDPASYAFSRGTKRPHTADSSDGSSVTGGRDSPFKYGGVGGIGGRERGFGFDFERDRPPSTAATADERPPSRRLSLMELCTPPASSSGRPGTGSGRGPSFGTLGPVFRTGTSDGRWAGKNVVEESDSGSSDGDIESPTADVVGEHESATATGPAAATTDANVPSATSSTHDGDFGPADKSAEADVHSSADPVVRVPKSPSSPRNISRSGSAKAASRAFDIAIGKEYVQGDNRTVDRSSSPATLDHIRGPVAYRAAASYTPSHEPSRSDTQSVSSADDDRTPGPTAFPVPVPISAHVGGLGGDPSIGVQQQQQQLLPSRPQSVLSAASRDDSPAVRRTPTPAGGQHARAVHTPKSDAKAAVTFKTSSDNLSRSGSTDSRRSIVSATPRTATPSVNADVSRAGSTSARHHELTGSPGLLQA